MGGNYYNMVIFGDSQDMRELEDDSVQLVITSPPYYNAPFDYDGFYESYDRFLEVMNNVASEISRVLEEGRIAALVVDDTLINKQKYPIVADLTRIFIKHGFKYRERIVWIKPEGYIRISRRSGVLIKYPYPMYYYPDNLQESILIFQNGDFNYRSIPEEIREKSRIDLEEFKKKKWYLNVWYITNVLPIKNRLEKNIAAFPEEIPYRLIKLFSYEGETVLDPFLGSGTTLKVAIENGRIGVGYEIDLGLYNVIRKKLKLNDLQPTSGLIPLGSAARTLYSKINDDFGKVMEVIIRDDAKYIETKSDIKSAKTKKSTKRKKKKNERKNERKKDSAKE